MWRKIGCSFPFSNEFALHPLIFIDLSDQPTIGRLQTTDTDPKPTSHTCPARKSLQRAAQGMLLLLRHISNLFAEHLSDWSGSEKGQELRTQRAAEIEK